MLSVLPAAASTALLMGLVGGSHCLIMCAAPCAAVVGARRRGASAARRVDNAACGGDAATMADVPDARCAERDHPPAQVPAQVPVRVLHWSPAVPGASPGSPALLPLASAVSPRGGSLHRGLAFHSGRLAGYAAVGALAALAMDSLAWFTQRTAALHPVWTLLHVAVMAWGILMLVQSRQPAWLEQAGRSVWARVEPWVRAPSGVMVAGSAWVLMPCGLLYSALMVAALSGGPLQGGLTMLLFGLGSGLWLVAGPWLWGRLRGRLDGVRAQWGTRVAGGMLCAVAAWALWLDLVYKPSLWCR